MSEDAVTHVFIYTVWLGTYCTNLQCLHQHFQQHTAWCDKMSVFDTHTLWVCPSVPPPYVCWSPVTWSLGVNPLFFCGSLSLDMAELLRIRMNTKISWQLNMTLSHWTSADRKEEARADRLTHDKQHIYTVYWWQFLTMWMLAVQAQKISNMLDSNPTMTWLTAQGLFTEHVHCESLQYLTPSEYTFCKIYDWIWWFTDKKNMDRV